MLHPHHLVVRPIYSKVARIVEPQILNDELVQRYEQFEIIERSRRQVRSDCGDLGTFSRPWSLWVDASQYISSTISLDMISLAKIVRNSFQKRKMPETYIDDYMRTMLSKIANHLLENQTQYTVDEYLFIAGASSMGGARSWTKEKMIERMTEWVQGPTTLFNNDFTEAFSIMDNWLDQWVEQAPEDQLCWDDFKTDVIRWGTSGGVSIPEGLKPKLAKYGISKEDVQDVRTKNFLGMVDLMENGKIEDLLKLNRQRVIVALKEEQKTRMIAATPFPSYLEQCYILYVLGNPAWLSSTLSDRMFLRNMKKYAHRKYWAIDASEFDFNVAKELLQHFWAGLEARMIRRGWLQAAELCRRQLNDLDCLLCEMFNKKVAYKKGLLSGWRITSLFGSMISAICCEMIKRRVGVDFDYGTQGDDIIMYDDYGQVRSDVIDIAREIGIKTHPGKCMEGPDGDFLRRIFKRDCEYGYPARAVRSLFYANPWIEGKQFKGVSELVNNWWVWISRFFPFVNNNRFLNWAQHQLCADVTRWARTDISVKDIKALIKTPLQIGGLGVVETWDWSTCNVVNEKREGVKIPGIIGTIGRFFGVGSAKPTKITKKDIEQQIKFDYSRVPAWVRYFSQQVVKLSFVRTDNMFKTLLNVVLQYSKDSKIDQSETKSSIEALIGRMGGSVPDISAIVPIAYRRSNRIDEILQVIFGKDLVSAPLSLVLDSGFGEVTSTVETYRNAVWQWMMNKRNITKNNIFTAKAIVSSLSLRLFTTYSTL